MKDSTIIINEILESVERLIKKSFKKEKNVTI